MDKDDDERNVDAQLDEEQTRLERLRERPLIENHSNNARVEPRSSGDPRSAPPGGPLGTAGEATAATAVTEPAKGTEGTAIPGEEPGA